MTLKLIALCAWMYVLLLLRCDTDVRVERQRSADAAAGYSHKCQQLQQQLQEERNGKATALLEQQEQFQQQKHQLQALLAEAEDQLERQRRELSAGFLLQAQQIEAKHASAAADARAEAATAAALAEARAAEAAAAHEQAVEQLKQAEVRRTRGFWVQHLLCPGTALSSLSLFGSVPCSWRS